MNSQLPWMIYLMSDNFPLLDANLIFFHGIYDISHFYFECDLKSYLFIYLFF